MKPELLSPAGSMEALYAAIEGGADAIYIGGMKFGARAFSKNFTLDEIEYATGYAHMYGVKLYVAVNTLIYDNETAEFLDYVKRLHKIGVDAFIMQDIGMIDLVRKTLPNAEIHVSTQAHIHNLDGVKLLEKLGIKRTVLARETSIEEIEYIKKNSDIDLEIFIAGALCISYSGNCLMSSLIGGRSGNRGMCAGSCRLPYDLVDEKGKVINKDKYILSTKDLNTLEYLGRLIDLGVTSFKIEGRMKSPEYVYIVTKLYRHAIDTYLETGHVDIDKKLLSDLTKVFQRGFTKGFIFNEDNNNFINNKRPNHQGVEIGTVIDYYKGSIKVKLSDDLSLNDGIRILGNNDIGLIVTSMKLNGSLVHEAHKNDIVYIKVDDKVNVNSKVLKTKDSKLINTINKDINLKNRKKGIDISFKARVGSMSLTIKCGNDIITSTSDKVYEALKVPMNIEDVKNKLSKLGDTVYCIDNINIDITDNLFINIKDLNELRRDAINKLTEKRLEPIPYVESTYSIDVPNYEKACNVNYKVSSIDILSKLSNYHNIYVDDINLYNKIPNSIYILPRVSMNYPDIERVEVTSINGLNKYKNAITGPFLNVTNSYAVAFLHSIGVSLITLSYEMDYDKVKLLIDTYHERYNKHPNLEVIVYGYIEAMISKFNLLKYYNLNEGNYYLVSKFKNKYPIKIKDDKMIIYYDEIRNDTSDYFSIGVNNIRLDIENNTDLKNLSKR